MAETKARLKVKEFEDRVREARDSWIKESLKGTRLEERVKKQLNESLQSMVWYILGLEKDGWHGRDVTWRISRVNGREPAIYHAINEAIEEAAVAVVADAVSGPIELSKAQRDGIRKEYVDRLAYRAKQLAGEEADRISLEIMERVLDEVGETEKPFCEACRVKHLEPLHDPETKEPTA